MFKTYYSDNYLSEASLDTLKKGIRNETQGTVHNIRDKDHRPIRDSHNWLKETQLSNLSRKGFNDDLSLGDHNLPYNDRFPRDRCTNEKGLSPTSRIVSIIIFHF